MKAKYKKMKTEKYKKIETININGIDVDKDNIKGLNYVANSAFVGLQAAADLAITLAKYYNCDANIFLKYIISLFEEGHFNGEGFNNCVTSAQAIKMFEEAKNEK